MQTCCLRYRRGRSTTGPEFSVFSFQESRFVAALLLTRKTIGPRFSFASTTLPARSAVEASHSGTRWNESRRQAFAFGYPEFAPVESKQHEVSHYEFHVDPGKIPVRPKTLPVVAKEFQVPGNVESVEAKKMSVQPQKVSVPPKSFLVRPKKMQGRSRLEHFSRRSGGPKAGYSSLHACFQGVTPHLAGTRASSSGV